ncbi:hypothetical protein [Roseimicrobium sp. ORNL1]|uniref:hypothetical protein n=1 Tax=Roseimicrobium sp. ORNL1 TaxID=2711231 RepID=UPI0013E0F219|nr:hypothetical protein [Roseimicrobium sp. ORNL1]QIF02764.1 hypothetical protein G5S37_14955 [Roseimicrobium sp. ORNL1]
MNIYTFLVLVLLAGGGFLFFVEKKGSAAREQSTAVPVARQSPEPRPIVEPPARPTPVEPADTTPGSVPAPVEEAPGPQLPPAWYTARRISVMTDTGVSSVPAGVEVTKVSDTEILYQGKRFAVKPQDLTNDVLVVAEILDKQDVAEARVQAQREEDTVREQSNVATVQAQNEEKKAEQQRQINAAIVSIERQIEALNRKIDQERHAENLAKLYGRVSSRGVTITKCEQAIAKLEAERLRLTLMK